MKIFKIKFYLNILHMNLAFGLLIISFLDRVEFLLNGPLIHIELYL